MVDDEAVEPAERRERLVDDLRDTRLLTDIGDHHVGAGLLGDCAQRRLAAPADHHLVAAPARVRATAAPMPVPPPVTRTTLPGAAPISCSRHVVEEVVDERGRPDSDVRVEGGDVLQQHVGVEPAVAGVLGAAVLEPAADTVGIDLGMELHGEVAAEHERLRRRGVDADDRRVRRRHEPVVVPLRPDPGHRRHSRHDVRADLRGRRCDDLAAVRVGEHLTAEADAEDGHSGLVRGAQQLELGLHPRRDLVAVDAPPGTQHEDGVVVARVREVEVHARIVGAVRRDHLDALDVVAALDEALLDRPGRQVVVPDEQQPLRGCRHQPIASARFMTSLQNDSISDLSSMYMDGLMHIVVKPCSSCSGMESIDSPRSASEWSSGKR